MAALSGDSSAEKLSIPNLQDLARLNVYKRRGFHQRFDWVLDELTPRARELILEDDYSQDLAIHLLYLNAAVTMIGSLVDLHTAGTLINQ